MSWSTSPPEFDVAVVGSGPAGCACAITAADRGLRVALFEAQRELADKPCGEGIMPAGVDALRELGLGEVMSSGREFRSLRYVLPGTRPVEIALPRPGVAVDRPRLMHAFGARVSRCAAVTRISAHVEVERPREDEERRGFRIHAGSRTWSARSVVAADGLNGRCAAWLRTFEPTKIPPRRLGSRARLGLRARFTAGAPLDCVEVHFNCGTEIYLTPLAEGRVNVSVLLDGDEVARGGAASLLQRALEENPHAASRLSTCVTMPSARRLTCRLPPLVAADSAFLAGDAGGGIDPILGCGVTLALESGILAARAAHSIVAGDESGEPEKQYVREYASRARSRRALASFLLTLSHHPLLARATVRFARVLPRLVEPLVRIAAGEERSASGIGDANRSPTSVVPECDRGLAIESSNAGVIVGP
jgi:flavin-dependent dehydrogenase